MTPVNVVSEKSCVLVGVEVGEIDGVKVSVNGLAVAVPLASSLGDAVGELDGVKLLVGLGVKEGDALAVLDAGAV